jgi:hypothetical protein
LKTDKPTNDILILINKIMIRNAYFKLFILIFILQTWKFSEIDAWQAFKKWAKGSQ